MCRILRISKFSVPAKNSQCVEFYTLDGGDNKHRGLPAIWGGISWKMAGRSDRFFGGI